MRVTERQMLDLLVAYVRKRKLRIGTPDYTINHFAEPQWRCCGNRRYYQLPRKGKILAVMNTATGACKFSTRGFSERKISDACILGRDIWGI